MGPFFHLKTPKEQNLSLPNLCVSGVGFKWIWWKTVSDTWVMKIAKATTNLRYALWMIGSISWKKPLINTQCLPSHSGSCLRFSNCLGRSIYAEQLQRGGEKSEMTQIQSPATAGEQEAASPCDTNESNYQQKHNQLVMLLFAVCGVLGSYNPAQSNREKPSPVPRPMHITRPTRLHLSPIRITPDKTSPSGYDLLSIYHAAVVCNKTYPEKLTLMLGCHGKLVES